MTIIISSNSHTRASAGICRTTRDGITKKLGKNAMPGYLWSRTTRARYCCCSEHISNTRVRNRSYCSCAGTRSSTFVVLLFSHLSFARVCVLVFLREFSPTWEKQADKLRYSLTDCTRRTVKNGNYYRCYYLPDNNHFRPADGRRRGIENLTLGTLWTNNDRDVVIKQYKHNVRR